MRPEWDEMCWLRVSNPSDRDAMVKHIVDIAVPSERDMVIQSGKTVSVNMQYGAKLDIGGVVIGPVTSPKATSVPDVRMCRSVEQE